MSEDELRRLSHEPPLGDLYDRLCRALDKGTGVRLRAADVDWLIISGAYRRILEAVADVAFDAAVTRIEARGGHIPKALLASRGKLHKKNAPPSEAGPVKS